MPVFFWFRALSLGPHTDHGVHPFRLKPGEGKFIAINYGFGFAQLVLIALVAGSGAVISFIPNIAVIIISSLLLAAGAIYATVKILRWSFILPAYSINASISLKEANRLSKGLIGRFLWFCTLTFLPFIVFSISVNFITIMYSSGFMETGRFNLEENILFFLIGELPGIALLLYTTMLNIGALSRLYQWSVQERGLPEYSS